MQDQKDVAIALMGAGVSLAGLLLVVAGLVFSQANTFRPEEMDDRTIERYKKAGKLGLIPVILSLLEAALCVVWLIYRSNCLLCVDIIGFFLLLAATALYGSVLILRYL